jgi:hypothetical protein
MSKFNFDQGDDLSDFLGGDASPAPKALPEGDAFARIRAMADQAPAAKTFKINCVKCNGRGRFVSYSGRDCGPCFKCEGKGSFERKSSPAQLAKAKEARAALPGKRWDAFQAEQPAMAAFLVKTLARGDKLPEGFRNTLVSIKDAIDRYGFDGLTEGRVAVLERGVAREAAYVASKAVNQPAQAVPATPRLDVSKIVECFQRAAEAGLKRFTLRFDGVHFQVDRNDPNLIWVSASGYGSAKYGRIVGDAYRPGRDVTAEIQAKVVEIAKDPMASAMAYAQVTSSCSVCGRHLENQDSVDAGIGPVCAGRLNRPGLKWEEVKDF